MNILQKISKIILIMACIICSANFVHAQAKNAIGLGVGLNTSREGAGFGAILQGEVKLTNAISITPSLGAEIPYVVHLGIGGRYYFSDEVYGALGTFGHIGGDDGASAGLGGTAGIGFILLATSRHVVDLNFHADLFENDHRRITVAGLRLIYSFSLSRLK
ncbi:hypothetical protein [Mucilaginibacter aquaedulcis]|uniref:hypothetical protein n=1 Tax=Mucilaginibacter aquaedulcis TaxID=1187081 RepID=UPI0025B300A9|nr:hypothetical protein [Mucilaginibacter aquaedulcis]MDN3550379.1 hypothetical protein [Mucilaginibacter aquaedulcis]